MTQSLSELRKFHPYHCIKCGQFVGNTNLGGYMTDKVSKRGSKAYCQKCVDRTIADDPESGGGLRNG